MRHLWVATVVEKVVMRAAGILFMTRDWKVLLMHRVAHQSSDEGDAPDAPNLWAFPGGGLEGEETAEQAARREVLEETGLDYTGPLRLWTRRVRDEVDFSTFLAILDEPFTPTLNDEHDMFNWVDRLFALSSAALHPGVYIALNRFDMDELSIAKAIIGGDLASPQRYENVMLIAIRITGTGLSYRSAHEEYVWRDPSLYMNPEFLERCNGLPVLFEHPDKSMLNSEEFRSRVVGTVFVPYFKGDEVWGIAKVFDAAAADLLETEAMSTSPGVLCMGQKVPVLGGKKMLIEDKPTLLDHVALLIPRPGESGAGVWDKGTGINGVESVDVKTDDGPDDILDTILRNVKVDEVYRRSSRI